LKDDGPEAILASSIIRKWKVAQPDLPQALSPEMVVDHREIKRWKECDARSESRPASLRRLTAQNVHDVENVLRRYKKGRAGDRGVERTGASQGSPCPVCEGGRKIRLTMRRLPRLGVGQPGYLIRLFVPARTRPMMRGVRLCRLVCRHLADAAGPLVLATTATRMI
jgi:hypothetical protein